MIIEVSPDTFAAGPAVALRRVAEAADAHDGVNTLNEQTCLLLKHHGIDGARLWFADDDGEVAGFALLRDGELDLVVHPESRGRGVGGALAGVVADAQARVEAWSHADLPAARKLAERYQVPETRELIVMSRPTSTPVIEVPAPEGISLRGYRLGDDEQLLQINAGAFSRHPDQGEMSAEDFAARVEETWFDPEGLIIAVNDDDGRLLGFHWTKVHRDEQPPYGEVYVVAVDPHIAGRGLGKVLTAAGLKHLAGTGVEQVILYVEGDNAPALSVYRGQGFEEARTEVQYQGTPVRPA